MRNSVAQRRIEPEPRRTTDFDHTALLRIEASLKRIEKLFDEFAGVLLNARFPYGKPTDRWARR